MVMFVLLVDMVTMRAMFKCVLMKNGDMSVITTGTMLMLKLFVSSWVTQHHVSYVIIYDD